MFRKLLRPVYGIHTDSYELLNVETNTQNRLSQDHQTEMLSLMQTHKKAKINK